MRLEKHSIQKRLSAWGLIVLMFVSSWLDTAVFALTSGPQQPEYASFSPVGTSNMVDLYTGAFNYSIPVVTVPGPAGMSYSVSLDYNSHVTMEDEASWVGLGWNLNTGAITRNRRGFPDEFRGVNVTNVNKDRPYVSIVSSTGPSAELFSFEKTPLLDVSASYSLDFTWNSRSGFGLSNSLSFANAFGSVGGTLSNRTLVFDASFSPRLNYTRSKKNDLRRNEQNKRMNSPFRSNGTIRLGDFGQSRHNFGSMKTETGTATFGAGTMLAGTPFEGGLNLSSDISITITNYLNSTKPAYGYLFSAEAEKDDNALMDYYSEKGQQYSDRDYFLGVPFSSPDQFVVTGGSGGSFRLYNKGVGIFRPDRVVNRQEAMSVSLIGEAGAFTGAGINAGLNGGTSVTGGWDIHKDDVDNFKFESTNSEVQRPLFMALNGDKGLTVERFENGGSGALNASINSNALAVDDPLTGRETEVVVGGGIYRPNLPAEMDVQPTEINAKQNTTVQYRFHHELGDADMSFDPNYAAHNSPFILNSEDAIKDGIGQIAITTTDGYKSVYGLPVYARNEAELTYDVPQDVANFSKKVVSRDISNSKVERGQKRDAPYASQFLLTSRLTSDYRDLTGDGPTSDDIGGWVKLNYKQQFGSAIKDGQSSGWYQWRIPYNGLNYDRGQLSDLKDDVGSVQYGEKEIYYTDYIETSTHIARFITEDRKDGVQASDNATSANRATGMGDYSIKLQALKEVVLYKKPADYSPVGGPDYTACTELQRTHFDYSYELCPGIPNNYEGSGKLTLKRVWTTYGGVEEHSDYYRPYVFDYDYGIYGYPGEYTDLDDYNGWGTSSSSNNPSYDPTQSDAWGMPVENGEGVNRTRLQLYGADQLVDQSAHDYAPWSLKSIILPTGGEMHVQYEANDYAFVQDQQATVLMPLLATSSWNGATESMDYKIDLTNSAQLTGVFGNDLGSYASMLNEYAANDRIYGRFLYRLKDAGPVPDIGQCNVEHITGYMSGAQASYDGTNLIISFPASENGGVLPDDVCKQYWNLIRSGNYNRSGDCGDDGSSIVPEDEIGENDLLTIAGQVSARHSEGLDNGNLCPDLNWSQSYLRLPVMNRKRGGGARVKRLLTFDNSFGASSGDKDPQLFGMEFFYQAFDQDGAIISSGVATNEPGGSREENALIKHAPNAEQGLVSVLTSGKMIEQAEDPYGESLLPGPIVTYSAVQVEPIHKGLSATGFTESRFLTTKDYPTTGRWKNSTIKGREITDLKRVVGGLPGIGVGAADEAEPASDTKPGTDGSSVSIGVSMLRKWLLQGYSFHVTDLPGKMVESTLYSGSAENLEYGSASSRSTYEYFEPGDQLPFLNEQFGTDLDDMPKHEEVVVETSKMVDHNYGGGMFNDLGTTTGTPLFQYSFSLSANYRLVEIRKAVVNRMVSYPTFLKKSTQTQDGLTTSSEVLGFDRATGEAVWTQAQDDYDGLAIDGNSSKSSHIQSITVPAHVKYEGLAQKSGRLDKIVSGLSVELDEHTYYLKTNAGCVSEQLKSGDLVLLTDQLYDDLSENGVQKSVVELGELKEGRFELHGIGKDPSGSVVTAGYPSLYARIIEPVEANRLGENVQQINTYNAPVWQDGVTNDLGKADLIQDLQNKVASAQPTFAVVEPQNTASPLIGFGADCGNVGYKVNDQYLVFGDELSTDVTNEMLINPGLTSGMINGTCGSFVANKNAYSDPPEGATVVDTDDQYFDCTQGWTQLGGVLTEHEDGATFTGQPINCESSIIQDVQLESAQNYILRVEQEQANQADLKVGLTDFSQYDHLSNSCSWSFSNGDQILKNGATPFEIENGLAVTEVPFTVPVGRTYGLLAKFMNADENLDHLVTKISIVKVEYPCAIPTANVDQFYYDPESNGIQYTQPGDPCTKHSISCVAFCNGTPPTLGNVISASATRYQYQWPYDEDAESVTLDYNISPHRSGHSGNPRPFISYGYKSNEVVNGVNKTSAERNHADAGVFTMDQYNWHQGAYNDPSKWVAPSSVTQYSPHGYPVQEVNALGIQSAVKFGYDRTVPYIIANNANNQEIFFESFENLYGGSHLEDGVPMPLVGVHTSSESHGGGASWSVASGTSGKVLETNSMKLSTNVLDDGIIVKFWAKTTDAKAVEDHVSVNFNGWLPNSDLSINQGVTHKATSGDWDLFEARIEHLSEQFGFEVPDNAFEQNYTLSIYADGSAGLFYLDDISIHPLNAQVVCHVYDVDLLRPVATFDDQHFGRFYQYNPEGQMIREQIETERGVKTVSQNHMHVSQRQKSLDE